MRRMISINRDRIRELIAEQKTSARAVSREVGNNDTLIRDILSGKSRNARGDTMAKIADYFRVPVRELMLNTQESELSETPLSELPLLEPIQAGAFREVDDSAQDEPKSETVALDRRFGHAAQWLRPVEGDSMNGRHINPGDLAHIVEFISSGIALTTGRIVEVTRSRAGGALREITLKEVEIIEDGSVLLWPRSTNPRWKDPIRLDDDSGGDVTVEITGVLLAKITRF